MPNKIMTCSILMLLLCCKDPAKMKKDQQDKEQPAVQDTLETGTNPATAAFDKTLLMGNWKIDGDSIKREIIRNCATKKEADSYKKDIDILKTYKVRFNEDGTYELFLAGRNAMGRWGMSSDNSSYWIRMADDFIELHEIKNLTVNRLTEFPVAQWKVAQLPVKQLVFNKTE